MTENMENELMENDVPELDEIKAEGKETEKPKKKNLNEELDELTEKIKALSVKKQKEMSIDEKLELMNLKSEKRKIKEKISRQKENKAIRNLKKMAQKGTDQAFLNNLHAWGMTDENQLKGMKRAFDIVTEYGITTADNLKAVLEYAKQNKPDLLK